MGLLEGEQTEEEPEKLNEEKVDEHFPNMGKKADIQIQEAQKVPNKMNPKRHTPRHITIKMVMGGVGGET